MAIYEVATVTTIVTASAGTPIAAFRAGSRPMHIYEIGVSALTAPATSGQLGLAYSTAVGTGALTQTFGATVDPQNFNTASLGSIVTAWGTTAPTLGSSVYKRRFAFPPSIGAAVIWSWPGDREIVVPITGSVQAELVLVNLQATAPGTWCVYCVFEE